MQIRRTQSVLNILSWRKLLVFNFSRYGMTLQKPTVLSLLNAWPNWSTSSRIFGFRLMAACTFGTRSRRHLNRYHEIRQRIQGVCFVLALHVVHRGLMALLRAICSPILMGLLSWNLGKGLYRDVSLELVSPHQKTSIHFFTAQYKTTSPHST